jgi:DNA-binding transcriptional LysR family regulator
LVIAVMRFLHHLGDMISLLRSFLAVIEEGSLHRAAKRLNLSQSALSRQMQALEHELGGKLLERSSTGVKPTSGGHALAAKMKEFLAGYDSALLEVRRLMQGESAQLRIGYLASAFEEYLGPALKVVRQQHPKIKVKLLDLFPGEQIDALRRGEIDIGLTQETGNLLGREFYTRKLAVSKSLVCIPACHPLASRKQIRLAELKSETFVSGPDDHVPGYRRRLMRLCWDCGKFRPRMISTTEGLAGGLAMVGNEDAVALLPAFMRQLSSPGIVMIPIADAKATWDLFVVWQRGKITGPLRTLLDALPFPAANSAL